jgi:uncharacterized protein (DUF3084 family)
MGSDISDLCCGERNQFMTEVEPMAITSVGPTKGACRKSERRLETLSEPSESRAKGLVRPFGNNPNDHGTKVHVCDACSRRHELMLPL